MTGQRSHSSSSRENLWVASTSSRRWSIVGSSRSSSLGRLIYLCSYTLEFHNAITVLGVSPITPPPTPSQPGILARHTGHLGSTHQLHNRDQLRRPNLASTPSASRENRARPIDASTALNRHSPQHTCPLWTYMNSHHDNWFRSHAHQGVIVALVTTPKQMGQVYAEKGSTVGDCSLSSNWVWGGSSGWDSCTSSSSSGFGKTSSSSGGRAGRLPLAFSDRGPRRGSSFSSSEFSSSSLGRLGER